MPKRHVVLLFSQPLLAEALAALLSARPEVELTGPRSLDAGALTELAAHPPDLVLIAGDERDEAVAALTTRILARHPTLRVLQIGLGNPSLHLYTCHMFPAGSAELIEIVLEPPTPGGS